MIGVSRISDDSQRCNVLSSIGLPVIGFKSSFSDDERRCSIRIERSRSDDLIKALLIVNRRLESDGK